MRRYTLASAPDPYPLPATDEPLNQFNYIPFDKTPVQPQALQLGESTAVHVPIGQSTGSCNTEGSTIYANDGHYTPTSPKAQNFNVADGAIYPASTPLLGCQGFAGNWNARITQMAIDAGLWQRYIVAPMGVGGTSIAQWQPTGGILWQRVVTMKARLASRGLTPTFVTWQQGEQDALLGTSQAAYAASGADLLSGIQSLWPNVPIFIAQTSFTGSVTSSNVTNAQASLVNPGLNRYAGPNTDLIVGSTYRQNAGASPHFTAAGSVALATAWLAAINAVF